MAGEKYGLTAVATSACRATQSTPQPARREVRPPGQTRSEPACPSRSASGCSMATKAKPRFHWPRSCRGMHLPQYEAGRRGGSRHNSFDTCFAKAIRPCEQVQRKWCASTTFSTVKNRRPERCDDVRHELVQFPPMHSPRERPRCVSPCDAAGGRDRPARPASRHPATAHREPRQATVVGSPCPPCKKPRHVRKGSYLLHSPKSNRCQDRMAEPRKMQAARSLVRHVLLAAEPARRFGGQRNNAEQALSNRRVGSVPANREDELGRPPKPIPPKLDAAAANGYHQSVVLVAPPNGSFQGPIFPRTQAPEIRRI